MKTFLEQFIQTDVIPLASAVHARLHGQQTMEKLVEAIAAKVAVAKKWADTNDVDVLLENRPQNYRAAVTALLCLPVASFWEKWTDATKRVEEPSGDPQPIDQWLTEWEDTPPLKGNKKLKEY